MARAYGVYLEDEDASARTLFVIDERGTVRWSRAYPVLVNPGVDGIFCALEPTEEAARRRVDEGGPA